MKSEIVCPKPQTPPIIAELHKDLRSVTIVETAAKWSDSTACFKPSRKPRVKTPAAEVEANASKKSFIEGVKVSRQRVIANHRADAGDDERAHDGQRFDQTIIAERGIIENFPDVQKNQSDGG